MQIKVPHTFHLVDVHDRRGVVDTQQNFAIPELFHKTF